MIRLVHHAHKLETSRPQAPPPLARLGDLPALHALIAKIDNESNRGPIMTETARNQTEPKGDDAPPPSEPVRGRRKQKVYVSEREKLEAVIDMMRGKTSAEAICERYGVSKGTPYNWREAFGAHAARIVDLERREAAARSAESRAAEQPPFERRLFPSPVVDLRARPPSSPPLDDLRARPPSSPPLDGDDAGAYARRIMAGSRPDVAQLERENAELRAELERVRAERNAMVEAHKLLAAYAAEGAT